MEKGAVIRVQDLETLEQFKINTAHAVLNVPTEASTTATLFSNWPRSCITGEPIGGKGRSRGRNAHAVAARYFLG